MITEDIQTHWTAIQPYLTIRDERDYDRAVEQLDQLIDEVGANEDHPLYEFLDTLGVIVHAYEQEHQPIPEASGIEVLKYLMEEQGLRQTDLPEVGSQGVVSEILSGKRALNVRQIQALARRFRVSPAVFI